jgi:outer membrane protein
MWKMCLAALALCLVTANTAPAAEFKIAYADMREIVTKSEPAQKAKATMESKFRAERDRLGKQEKELQKQAESLKNPGAGQSREALEQKRRDFISKQQELEQKVREYTNRFEKEQATLQNELLDLIFKAAKEFAGKKGITYFVDINAGILYADPALDMTAEFMEEVNRQWKEKKK